MSFDWIGAGQLALDLLFSFNFPSSESLNLGNLSRFGHFHQLGSQ